MTIKIQEEYQKLSGKYQTFTEFNFNELFVWNTDNDVKVSLLHGNVVVIRPDYITGNPVLSFVGNSSVHKTIQTLLNYSDMNGYDCALYNLPAEQLPHYLLPDISSYPDLNHRDYVLNAKKHLLLEGSGYSSIRAKIRKFDALYGESCSTRLLDFEDCEDLEKFWDLFERWRLSSHKTLAATLHEKLAIRRAIEHAAQLNLRTLGLFYNDTLIGCTIHAPVDDDYEIGLFLKADYAFVRVYDRLVYENARACIADGRQYINIEHDLGIEQLRVAKQQLHPDHFFDKVVITAHVATVDTAAEHMYAAG